MTREREREREREEDEEKGGGVTLSHCCFAVEATQYRPLPSG
jgi:hypothetical protein